MCLLLRCSDVRLFYINVGDEFEMWGNDQRGALKRYLAVCVWSVQVLDYATVVLVMRIIVRVVRRPAAEKALPL